MYQIIDSIKNNYLLSSYSITKELKHFEFEENDFLA
jgi:hypothetical protein